MIDPTAKSNIEQVLLGMQGSVDEHSTKNALRTLCWLYNGNSNVIDTQPLPMAIDYVLLLILARES